MYEIKGAKGYNVCSISCSPEEMEILLQSNLKFKVTEINNNFMIFDKNFEFQNSFKKIVLELTP